MPKQITEDLAFFHIQSVLQLHVQGEENSIPSYFIFAFHLLASTL
jgi:hypothetical protein